VLGKYVRIDFTHIKTSENIIELTSDNGSTHSLVLVLELGNSIKEHKRTNDMAEMKLLKLVAGCTVQKRYRNKSRIKYIQLK
jgi:hypothetical protein